MNNTNLIVIYLFFTFRSVIELTPVEFACETMANVEKELCDLIAQYKADPNKNINPFSMRLQGIIDANVMGGISKYQEAFFTEQFLKSSEGVGQQNNVHKLKCLILEQVQILDTALELHGQLAPIGVQPLHKRLLERFSQLKQSLTGMGKFKRQHSESIINTPLPPLPIEKRALSLGTHQSAGIYEKDDIYTRPIENSCQIKLNRQDLALPELLRESNVPGTLPPIPIRPKSAGYATMNESPEIPPKNIKDKSNAPPLPPRGYTPDKRASNPMPFGSGEFEQSSSTNAPNIPKRSHKYSVVNISLDDECEADHQFSHQTQEHIVETPINDGNCVVYRDSGISSSSNDLNHPKYRHSNEDAASAYATKYQQKTNLNSKPLNIQMVDDSFDGEYYDSYPPPPIPPKSNFFVQDQSSEVNSEHSSPSTLTQAEFVAHDDYCAETSFDGKD